MEDMGVWRKVKVCGEIFIQAGNTLSLREAREC
jgi:hypothetical protein